MRLRSQIVCASAESRTRTGHAKWLVAFWIPVPFGKWTRRDMRARPSAVTDASEAELRALADGALLEVTASFRFPLNMPMTARRQVIDQEWRAQCQKRFGAAPDAKTGIIVTPGATFET